VNITPHHTGHVLARDGRLVRVDRVPRSRGGGWLATRYNADMSIHDEFYGTDEQVHALAQRWSNLD
jgi:hypothetical protein